MCIPTTTGSSILRYVYLSFSKLKLITKYRLLILSDSPRYLPDAGPHYPSDPVVDSDLSIALPRQTPTRCLANCTLPHPHIEGYSRSSEPIHSSLHGYRTKMTFLPIVSPTPCTVDGMFVLTTTRTTKKGKYGFGNNRQTSENAPRCHRFHPKNVARPQPTTTYLCIL